MLAPSLVILRGRLYPAIRRSQCRIFLRVLWPFWDCDANLGECEVKRQILQEIGDMLPFLNLEALFSRGVTPRFHAPPAEENCPFKRHGGIAGKCTLGPKLLFSGGIITLMRTPFECFRVFSFYDTLNDPRRGKLCRFIDLPVTNFKSLSF
jgi:hypothetical protein